MHFSSAARGRPIIVEWRETQASAGLSRLVFQLSKHDEVGGDQTQQADGQARVHGDEAPDAQRERPELDQLQKPPDVSSFFSI
ncbi:hypothetical protein EVAR_71132_1 [Eumeta japonica]|uniref:Uncharacterized protein n=1 Tax=Eumeta variegata TaxID=151549 RepID=A0A4C1ZL59_EUMVA|nr:hypothetical protein EVAR_71132_1 [Eumeta japonica]